MASQSTHSHPLRLMTYNIQVGIRTQRYSDYLRHGWRHVLPPASRTQHLEPIARILRDHDLVAIQEADAGSFRTRSINLVHYLAERAQFPYWHLHGHRSLAPLARHGMGLLSRIPLRSVEAHALPGRISGRAAVIYRFGQGSGILTVVVTHLSLGRSDRGLQLSHLADLVQSDPHVILMGDLNCEAPEFRSHHWFRERGFLAPVDDLHSYPSWRPRRQLDHILVTPEFSILSAGAKSFRWSDHLPVTMDVELPAGITLDRTTSEVQSDVPTRIAAAATTAWTASLRE